MNGSRGGWFKRRDEEEADHEKAFKSWIVRMMFKEKRGEWLEKTNTNKYTMTDRYMLKLHLVMLSGLFPKWLLLWYLCEFCFRWCVLWVYYRKKEQKRENKSYVNVNHRFLSISRRLRAWIFSRQKKKKRWRKMSMISLPLVEKLIFRFPPDDAPAKRFFFSQFIIQIILNHPVWSPSAKGAPK